MAIADPTADYAESYLDVAFDGDKTFYAWFRNAAGGVSDRTADSIARYQPAGRARDAGMTACYDVNNPIVCPAEGNAFFGQDAQYVGLLSTYTTGAGLRDGTVRDNLTGLVWRRVLDSATRGSRTFGQLTEICANLDLGGYGDWRVPTAREAENLLAHGFSSILPAPFAGAGAIGEGAEGIWTRTPFVGGPNRTYVMERFRSSLSQDEGISNPADVTSDVDTSNICVRGVSRFPFDYDFTVQDKGTDLTSDDTVVESRTGLVWDRRETTTRNWQSALAYCEGLNYDGKTDWRLPSLNELLTLADYDDTADAKIDPAFAWAVAGFYWTSTTVDGTGARFALGVDFSLSLYDQIRKDGSIYVRCLRND